MPLWTKDTPPAWKPDAIKTSKGWIDPVTSEILVASASLVDSSAATIQSVRFDSDTYLPDADISVFVKYNEKVDVTSGATLVVSWSGEDGDITLTAAEQLNAYEVEFTGTVPDEEGTLSIGDQTISGTIEDDSGALKARAVLTLTANPSNTETVTIGSKTYTFQTTLTNSDGNVKIGANLNESLVNLAHAIVANASTAGVLFAAAMTASTQVDVDYVADTKLGIIAKTAGTAANSFATTDTLAAGAFGGSVMAGGAAAGNASKAISEDVADAAGEIEVVAE